MPKIRPIEGLYAITPRVEEDQQLFLNVEQALKGGVTTLQYRDKDMPVDRKWSRARRLQTLCRDYDCLFLINDDIEICLELGADGVHVGRDDMSIERARDRLGSDVIIGVSCYDQLTLAQDAQRRGADYVAFGSVFSSTVKPHAVRASLELFKNASQRIKLPIVAIGGIDLSNAAMVFAAGAHAVAVITGLFGTDDIEARARAFRMLFTQSQSIRPS